MALAGQYVVIEPASLRSEALEKEARDYLPTFGYPRPRETMAANAPLTQKSFEVWKVLLEAWLQNEGPLTAQGIGRRARASSRHFNQPSRGFGFAARLPTREIDPSS